MLEYYFPFYKQKFCFSAGSLLFPYSEPLEIPRKMGFGDVPLKQHIGENARKLVKTGPKNGPDFFTHAQIIAHIFYDVTRMQMQTRMLQLSYWNGLRCNFTISMRVIRH